MCRGCPQPITIAPGLQNLLQWRDRNQCRLCKSSTQGWRRIICALLSSRIATARPTWSTHPRRCKIPAPARRCPFRSALPIRVLAVRGLLRCNGYSESHIAQALPFVAHGGADRTCRHLWPNSATRPVLISPPRSLIMRESLNEPPYCHAGLGRRDYPWAEHSGSSANTANVGPKLLRKNGGAAV